MILHEGKGTPVVAVVREGFRPRRAPAPVVVIHMLKDVAQMLPEAKLGALPREAMCAVRRW
jgi:hypothetical protein